MMLSNLVLDFLKRVIDSEEPIDDIINSYKYSERFVITMDFQVIHKVLTGDVPDEVYDKIALNHDPIIGLDFLKRLNNSKEALAKVASYYDEDQRCHIGVSIFNIQEKLLAEVKQFLGEEIDLTSTNSSIKDLEINH